MDERIFNYKPNLEGREPLDPKTIEDGTPVLIVNNDDERNYIYSLAVFRRKYDNAAECHLCFYAPDKHNAPDAYYALHYRDRSLHPDNNNSRENKDFVTIGSSCLGIECLHCLSFYLMNNHDITVLGTVLNSARLTWDMETLQLIDCDTHEVLSAAERPPQPAAPTFDPRITRTALRAMKDIAWKERAFWLLLELSDDDFDRSCVFIHFEDASAEIPTYFEVMSMSKFIRQKVDPDNEALTWAHLLYAITFCFPDGCTKYPALERLIAQIPISITITETQKQ